MKNLIYTMVVIAVITGGAWWFMSEQGIDTDDTMPLRDSAIQNDGAASLQSSTTTSGDAATTADIGIGEGN